MQAKKNELLKIEENCQKRSQFSNTFKCKEESPLLFHNSTNYKIILNNITNFINKMKNEEDINATS